MRLSRRQLHLGISNLPSGSSHIKAALVLYSFMEQKIWLKAPLPWQKGIFARGNVIYRIFGFMSFGTNDRLLRVVT